MWLGDDTLNKDPLSLNGLNGERARVRGEKAKM
jgi:hypothetical protein